MTGERICLGFDGSDNDDWSALKGESFDGVLFTPTYGPDQRPTIWNPLDWGGRIPRLEVAAAVIEVFDTFDVKRMYCDPPYWQTELDQWALDHGEEVVIEWPTYRMRQMHDELRRFVTDLETGSLHHDGCRITTAHVGNARKLARPGDRYAIGKPNQNSKIDAAVASVLAHAAACDARAAGWGAERAEPEPFVLVG